MGETNNYRLNFEERETILRIGEIPEENYWIVDTSIQKDINNFIDQGWEVIETHKYSDGSIKSMVFKAPRKYISVREYKTNTNRATRQKRVMSEEHKASLLNGLAKSKDNKSNT